MNMFKAFESRIAEAFGASAQGYTAPFSFKKLAKRAAKEVEAETYVIDGVDTAPALITILVSADDDAIMRPLYAQLTDEVTNFVEAEAARKGYVFVGKPLSRFMVDPTLRRGRFAVFANNVDAVSLEKLREEEIAFLAGSDSLGGAAAPLQQIDTIEPPAAENDPSAAPVAVDDMPIAEFALSDDSSAGLSVLPADFVDESLRAAGDAAPTPQAASLAASIPEVMADEAQAIAADPIVTPVPEVIAAAVPEVVEVSAAPAEIAVPATVRRDSAAADDSIVSPAPAPVAGEGDPATCLLIDRQSGRTYQGTAPVTAVGRERVPGGIVLHDPNVSRRHAELSFDGHVWRIRDLGSTNGTLVNDVDIDACILRDGDLITLGLLNLEFRES